MYYGGFWARFFAYLLDFVVLMFVLIPVVFLFGTPSVDPVTGATSYRLSEFVAFPIFLAYFVGFEGSARQATLGKMAMGLIVTDQSRARLSYLHALGRFFAKFISLFVFLIGFVMVAFTERKQGLHDMVARTLGVRGSSGRAAFDVKEFE